MGDANPISNVQSERADRFYPCGEKTVKHFVREYSETRLTP